MDFPKRNVAATVMIQPRRTAGAVTRQNMLKKIFFTQLILLSATLTVGIIYFGFLWFVQTIAITSVCSALGYFFAELKK